MKAKKTILQRRKAGSDLQHVCLHILKRAQCNLEKIEKNPEKNIHDFRVAMKKIRSLLRLISRNIPAAMEKMFARRIRKLKNALAENRESAVIAKTLRALDADSTIIGVLAPTAGKFTPLGEDVMEGLLTEMKTLRQEIHALPFEKILFSDLCAALSSSLRQMEERRCKCLSKPQAKNFHQWRKRSKDALYQNEILGKYGLGRRFEKAVKKLSDLLGDCNDLSVLERKLGATRVGGRQALLARVREKQDALRTEALHLARGIPGFTGVSADPENAAETAGR